MLVLTRRRKEKIHIGDAVITVLTIEGNRVRIGIDAPENVYIYRGEILKHDTAASQMHISVEAVTQQPR